MASNKSARELAFLYDLYVAPDWVERFAALMDDSVSVPSKGSAIYIEAGTGGHALKLKQKAGKNLALIGCDADPERVKLAQAKSETMKPEDQIQFRTESPGALSYAGEQFDLVLGDASFIAPQFLHGVLLEMIRVAATGGSVAMGFPTTSSFGEFFSVYWEALCNRGMMEYGHFVEEFINSLPAASSVEQWARSEGLVQVQSKTRKEEFTYASAEEFLSSTAVTDLLMKTWMAPLPSAQARSQVLKEIARIINEERHGTDFVLSIKATLIMGKKQMEA